MTHPERAVEYSALQTRFQNALEQLRAQTEATVRLRMDVEEVKTQTAIDAHSAARRVLQSMAEEATKLRTERDRAWRALKQRT